MASSTLDGIELSLFVSRVQSICDEMGVALRRSAFSPNIKDRLDFSCALFDARGALFGQAAHIPVHLGSMAAAACPDAPLPRPAGHACAKHR